MATATSDTHDKLIASTMHMVTNVVHTCDGDTLPAAIAAAAE